jgi:hypothetical protein
MAAAIPMKACPPATFRTFPWLLERMERPNGGTAIVIHAVAGGTGAGAPPRIACGVINKPE